MEEYKIIEILKELGIKYRKVATNRFRVRCPFCGDSKRDKRKKRGNLFYFDKEGYWAYKCWNGGCSKEKGTNIVLFVKEQNQQLYEKYFNKVSKEYIDKMFYPKIFEELEQKQELERKGYSKKEFLEKNNFVTLDELNFNVISDVELNPFNDVINNFLKKRNLLDFRKLFLFGKDNERLIIPFKYKEQYYGYQARRLFEYQRFHIKYFTEIYENWSKIWNLYYCLDNEYWDTFVFEGPLDALLFYKEYKNYQKRNNLNSPFTVLALTGSHISAEDYIKYKDFWHKKNIFFILDNDEAGKMESFNLVHRGIKCFIWENEKEKDLTDLFLSFKKIEDYDKYFKRLFQRFGRKEIYSIKNKIETILK